jgi:hydrogenase maturation protease
MRHLICFGNDLHGDDGFGTAVYRRLATLERPAGWHLFDAGTRGLDALALFQGCGEVILVDAAAPAGHPGRLAWPLPEEIAVESALPGHGSGVGYLLQALAALESAPPRLRILTAEMTAVTPFRSGLSPAVTLAVEQAAALLGRWMAGGFVLPWPLEYPK